MTDNDIQLILATIKTEINEFNFRIILKHQKPPQKSYLVLEAKAKTPSAHMWCFKSNSELAFVATGNFFPDLAKVIIPENIAKIPIVDYELHIAECSPNQVLILFKLTLIQYLVPNLHIPSTLKIYLILWHRQLIVCALKC